MKYLLPLIFILGACAHKAPTTVTATNTQDISKALRGMTGCYLVDYSFVELEAIKKGYKRDARVYDVNKVKSTKEWIYAENSGPNNIRLQHILFAADDKGQMINGSELKHQAEDWEYEAPVVYEFTGPSTWKAVPQQPGSQKWTRKITNLDDGLRYQCASPWKMGTTGYPEWSCDNYAPIPGRETRDMQRKDYNTLQRSTRIISYGNSWLERQTNTKTVDKDGKKTPLVNEFGKTWYVRLPDSDCSQAQAFAESRKEFWAVLRDTWEEVYKEGQNFVEKTTKGQPPRYAKMMEVEESFMKKDLTKPEVKKEAREAILKVINEYRETSMAKSNDSKKQY